MPDLSHSAIQCALSQDWKQAIKINVDILEKDKNDTEAMCRLAYAYSQLGRIDEAKRIYRKILTIDRYHAIARKNLDRISVIARSWGQTTDRTKVRISPNLFIEEPGKTKTVVLRNIAPVKRLAQVNIGDSVTLFAKNHSIEVRDQEKIYLGALPDDIAFRMIRFLKAGNVYQVSIKNVHKNTLSVFIRETRRGKRFIMQSTFSLGSYGAETSMHHAVKRVGKPQELSPLESETGFSEE